MIFDICIKQDYSIKLLSVDCMSLKYTINIQCQQFFCKMLLMCLFQNMQEHCIVHEV